MTSEPKSTARLDFLKEIEKDVQARWDEKNALEVNAPTDGSMPPKFLITFPFPYMNGKLHLGHAFSLTKAEFASRFQRMMGRRTLWPFGLHVTGTPIAACAQKLHNEMKKYGNPPVFPEEEPEEKKKEQIPGQHKSKRGKAGPAKPQWLIMKSLGLKDEEIPPFEDASYWLKYFPSLAKTDLKQFGVNVDWRRSFITTDANPFFDSFVSWQFRKLFEGKYLVFGKRYCIYSPVDGQPCADHDRASGEGVQPLEYCLVKIKVKSPEEQEAFKPFTEIIAGRDVILPSATMRSETSIGQTNCWVSPEITYKAYAITGKDGKEQVFIMTSRAARNLCYQDVTVNGKQATDGLEPLFEVNGANMVGLPLSAPYCKYDTIYALPMSTVKDTKGTGVVMSVPSDSPDDYINFTQLLHKPDYRSKLGVKDEWVVPFQITPIISVPGELGTESAAVACKKLGVGGPKDSIKLEEAKKMVYQAGFYNGVMIEGPFKDSKVPEAKLQMIKELTESNNGLRFYEPTDQVMSRSGDECVVALADQWFIEYGKAEWKKAVLEHVEKMNMYFPGIRHGFEETLNWLSDWPCSRTFGLGTKLPCDASKTMIIDSLSDSTIYMAYYTVAHYFHVDAEGNNVLDARTPNASGIMPEMINDAAWDYLLLGKGTPAELESATGLPAATAEKMRNEFTFWYPVDLRVSAKDLIQNHLTMFLYNHAAIWPDDESKWPRGIYCNGHIQVDNEKMSKSQGNFIMLRDAVEKYGADCTRLACADSGDSMDDANFVRENAVGFILKITTLIEQVKDLKAKSGTFRTGDKNIFDRITEDSINGVIYSASDNYTRMAFRMALQASYHELTNEFSSYRLATEEYNMHQDLVDKYVETISLLLQPLAPHVCEYIWSTVLGKETLVIDAPFPTAEGRNFGLRVSNRVISDVLKEMRSQLTKAAKGKRGMPEEILVYTARSFLPWQKSALEQLSTIAAENDGSLPADASKKVLALKAPWLTKDVIPDAMAFMALVKSNFDKFGPEALNVDPVVDDYALLKDLTGYLAKWGGVPKVSILEREDESIAEHKVARSKTRPGEPTVAFLSKKDEEQSKDGKKNGSEAKKDDKKKGEKKEEAKGEKKDEENKE